MSFLFAQRKYTIAAGNSAVAEDLLPSLYRHCRQLQQLLRQHCCEFTGSDCTSCRRFNECPIPLLFGQQLSHDPDIVRRHQKPPLPFAFAFTAVGDVIECRITIIGTALRFFGLISDAVQELLTADGANIIETQNVGYGRVEQPVVGNDDLVLLSADEVIERSIGSTGIFSIELLSPLRLVHNGVPCRVFDVSHFVRSQMRRISALSAYYGDAPLTHDFQEMRNRSDLIQSLEESYSYGVIGKDCDSRRNGGLIGSGEYMDVAQEISGLLVLGSYLNAGKGSAWGMGAYQVS